MTHFCKIWRDEFVVAAGLYAQNAETVRGIVERGALMTPARTSPFKESVRGFSPTLGAVRSVVHEPQPFRAGNSAPWQQLASDSRDSSGGIPSPSVIGSCRGHIKCR
jgi:hypothetical protein